MQGDDGREAGQGAEDGGAAGRGHAQGRQRRAQPPALLPSTPGQAAPPKPSALPQAQTGRAEGRWKEKELIESHFHIRTKPRYAPSLSPACAFNNGKLFAIPLNHRMVRVAKIIWFQTPGHEQGHLPPAQGAQSSIQPGLEHCQGGGSHSFSGQPGPGPHHPHGEEFLPNI